MWNVTGFEKHIGEGPWQTAGNVQIFAPFVRDGKKVVPCKWLTWPHQNQAIKLRAKVQVQPPGGQGYLAYSNEIEATVQNTVVDTVTGAPEDLVVLFDPEAQHPMLGWYVMHRDWAYTDAFPDQHLHYVVNVYSPSGAVVKTFTSRQDNPGANEVVWDGSCDPVGQASPGVYTYQVTAQHFYTPNGSQHPLTCSPVGECAADSDKLPRAATVTQFDPEIDEENQKMRGTVTYNLPAVVGVCQVAIFGLGYEKLWTWDADAERMISGSHETDEFEVEAQIVDGQLVSPGLYWAVVFTRQTDGEGAANRGLEPKWYVPHGVSLGGSWGTHLWSVSFDKDDAAKAIRMYWPERHELTNPLAPYEHLCSHTEAADCTWPTNEGVGLAGPEDPTPEWTAYRVEQPQFHRHPYIDDPGYQQYAARYSKHVKREPAAFVRDVHPVVTAKILGPPGQTVFVKAQGEGGSVGGLPEDDVTFDATTGMGTYHGVAEGGVYERVHTETIVWNWQYRLPETQTWLPLGASEHKVLVTLSLRQPPRSGEYPWVQLFEWSCEFCSSGNTTDYVFEHIWEQFANLWPNFGYWDNGDLVRDELDSDPLFYPDDGGEHQVITLERGRCNHYACLMNAMAAVQGDVVPVQELGAAPPWVQFHVKNFDLPGIRGHATTDPGQKYFANHYICWRGDRLTLYDPSYSFQAEGGDEEGALTNYETASVDAVRYTVTWHRVNEVPPPARPWLRFF